jgi:septal ring factor EnvC (AmiA/AmiB activator)
LRPIFLAILEYIILICALFIIGKRCAGATEEADELRKSLETEKEKTKELEVALNQKGRELAKIQQEMTTMKSHFEVLNAQAMTLTEEKAQLSKRVKSASFLYAKFNNT